MDDMDETQQSGRLAGDAGKGERRPGLRAAGIAGSRIAAPIVAKRGGGILARLKTDWMAIVGGEIAAICWPEALGRDGALKLRVAPSHALGLQHRAPLLIERITTFFGRGVVARIVLVQGTLPLAPATSAAAAIPPEQSPADDKALAVQLAGIADPELRSALARLGQLIVAGSRQRE